MADRRAAARRNRWAAPYVPPQQPQEPPARGRGRRRLNTRNTPFGNLTRDIQERASVQVLAVPRSPNVAEDGTYIPCALLNENLQSVALSRIREFIHWATLVANPRILSGTQESVNWRLVIARYNLQTRVGAHQNTVRGMIRKLAERPDAPVQWGNEEEEDIVLWHDEYNVPHPNMPQQPDSPRRNRFADRVENRNIDEPANAHVAQQQPSAEVQLPPQQQAAAEVQEEPQ